MNKFSLIFGFLPLLLFVAVDFFTDEMTGIAVAVVCASVEAIFSLIKYRKIDALTCGSFAFLGIFAFISLTTEDAIYFKFQPVALGILFSLTIFVCQLFDRPILPLILDKYGDFFPSQARYKLSHPGMQNHLSKLSLYLGFGFLIHAIAVAYSAVFMSNSWWLAIRGIGLYIVMAACLLLARFSERSNRM